MYCFAKICRLCMNHEDTLIHCKARDKNNIPNYHKIRVLFPQLVNKTSKHFPIWICIKCQEQVNESYEFKQKCYKTYRLLKKYTTQLHEANRGRKLPDVPSEIFQEIKSSRFKSDIDLDEEKSSDTYYNADDITIVKNELLPNNLKNEPEFHNMIQAIIDNNIEAVRKIDSSTDLKCETSTTNLKTVPEVELEEPEPELELDDEPELEIEINEKRELEIEIDEKRELIETYESQVEVEETPDVNNTPEDSTNNTTPEQTESTNELNAFTLDYTNASFETFVSHVGPKIPTPEETNNVEVTPPTTTGCQRVLRQRKSICYRTMEKGLDDLNEVPSMRRTRSFSEKSIPKTPTKQPQSIEKQTSPPKTSPKKQTIKNKRTTEISDVILTQNKNNVYFCSRCTKEYKRLPAFKIHVLKCKGAERDRHSCNECDKDFASAGNLKRHKRTAHNALRFKMKCTYCPNEYVNATFMRKHMQMRHHFFMDKRRPFIP